MAAREIRSMTVGELKTVLAKFKDTQKVQLDWNYTRGLEGEAGMVLELNIGNKHRHAKPLRYSTGF